MSTSRNTSNNTYQEARSIVQIIQDLDDNKLILPEFQRDFMWTIEKSEELFDSILRKIFIGALIFSTPKFSLACKKIDLRPRGSKKHRPKPREITTGEFDTTGMKTILDGQQRVTSIYRALKGIDELYIKLKNVKELTKKLNEEKERNRQLEIEEYIEGITSKENSDCYCVPMSKLVELKHKREEEVRTAIHEPIKENTALITTDEEDELFFDFLLKLRSDFNDILNDKTLLSVHLLDMGLEKFCKFFERSNSRGMTLSFMDILTAKLYIGFNLRKEIEKSSNKYRGYAKVIQDHKEQFVRYISFIVNEDVSKPSILKNLNAEHFKDYWEDSVDLFIKSYNYIEEQKLFYSMKDLPYKGMFIPLMHYVSNLPNKDFAMASAKQSKMLRIWFWASILVVRYGGGHVGSTNYLTAEDCSKLKILATKGEIDKKYWHQFRFALKKGDLIRIDKNNVVAKGIFAILNYNNNFKRIENNDNVEFKSAKFDIHHIFPSKFIEETFGNISEEYDRSDSFLNKTIINRIPNIKYGKKSPSEYLKLNPINKNNDIIKSLESHLIPNPQDLIDGKCDREYLEFIDLRYSVIKNILDKELVNKIKKF